MRSWAIWAAVRAAVFAAICACAASDWSLWLWLWAACTMVDLEGTRARILRRRDELGAWRR